MDGCIFLGTISKKLIFTIIYVSPIPWKESEPPTSTKPVSRHPKATTGKARMTELTQEQKDQIAAMSSPQEMDSDGTLRFAERLGQVQTLPWPQSLNCAPILRGKVFPKMFITIIRIILWWQLGLFKIYISQLWRSDSPYDTN